MDIRFLIFVVYLGIMLGIGVYFYRKNKSISDYVLGGRSLNVWVTAMSAQASDMSSWLLMGLPGLAYCYRMLESGPVFTYEAFYEAIWTGIGLLVGTYLNWLFVAKRLRTYTKVANDSLTISDFFKNRFKSQSRILKTTSAIIILIAFTLYTAAQFSAGAKLFNSVFGLPYHTGLIVGTIVIVGYTFLGGFLAVSWTDLIQGILMFIALIIVPIVAFSSVGGVAAFQERMAELALSVNGSTAVSGGASSNLIISSLAWGLGYFGMPHILVRFMGIRSAKEIKPARIIAMIWVIITMFCAIVVGLIGTIYIGESLTPSAAESIFVLIVEKMFNPVVQGILLTAILAAIMSTADSQLLVASAAFAEDICPLFAKTDRARRSLEKNKINLSRIAVIVIAIIALLLAMNPESSVFRLVQNAWAILGAAFGPVVLTSLYWKRMTERGAFAGMACGGIVTVIWKALSGFGGIFSVYELLPGFIAGLLAVYVFSMMDREPNRDVQKEFDMAMKENKAI